jgi:hypothetical protein
MRVNIRTPFVAVGRSESSMALPHDGYGRVSLDVLLVWKQSQDRFLAKLVVDQSAFILSNGYR